MKTKQLFSFLISIISITILLSSCGAGNKATSTRGNEYIAEEVEVYGCLFRIPLVRHSPNPVYGFWPEISS